MTWNQLHLLFYRIIHEYIFLSIKPQIYKIILLSVCFAKASNAGWWSEWAVFSTDWSVLCYLLTFHGYNVYNAIINKLIIGRLPWQN